MLTLTLLARLHGSDDTTPGIHNTLTQRDDIANHLNGTVRGSSDCSSLLEDLCHHRQICLKVSRDGTGDIAEALQNGRLELIGESGTLETSRLVVKKTTAHAGGGSIHTLKLFRR